MDWKQRNKNLKTIGFRNYSEYLASDLWKRIRTRVYKRDKNRCRYCGEPASQAHHENYSASTLAGRTISKIKAACDLCHRMLHGLLVGSKNKGKRFDQRRKVAGYTQATRVRRTGRVERLEDEVASLKEVVARLENRIDSLESDVQAPAFSIA